jgi:putative ABC transport system permease protein
MGLLGMAVFLCISIGVMAGIIPASIAAKMDAVVAIRSK